MTQKDIGVFYIKKIIWARKMWYNNISIELFYSVVKSCVSFNL